MNLLLTIVAVIVIVAGALVARRKSETTVELEQPIEDAGEAEGSTAEEEPVPTSGEIPTSTPTPIPARPPGNQSEEQSLQYPGSVRVRTEGEATVYESQDDSDRITDWYKAKIESMGMNAKSFVKTRTNDNVLNKLVGADGSREVSVEISKPADTSTVTIKVTSRNL